MELNLQVGPYIWLTYQEVYDKSIQIGSSIRERGVNPVRAILGFPLCLLWNVGIWPLILFILIGDEFSFWFGSFGSLCYGDCLMWQGGRCGIYGSNCPEWIIAMEVCTRCLLVHLNYVF